MQRLPTTSSTTTDTGLELAKWLGGTAAGALLMYMLDPDRGSDRRAKSAAAVRYAGARTTDTLGNVWRGASSRVSEAASDLRDSASDLVESAKPNGAAGGIGSTLSRVGQAASDLYDETVSKAKSMASRAGDAASDMTSKARSSATEAYYDSRYGSKGMASRFGDRVSSAMQGASGEWGSTARGSALLGGGLLALTGLMRRSPMGLLLGLAGAALLARGATNQSLRGMIGNRSLTPSLGLGDAIDFEKTIHIDASPDEVYEQFANYENFPRYMSHVSEVRDLGRRRSHWIVKGPGGTEFEWNSVLTEQNRPNRLAWRSESGAEIPNTGSIQFERHRGGTLVTVRMSYTPPAGAVGHGLALLLGSDPKSKMDEDLARMKAFIERGMMPRESARSGWGSRFLH